MGRKERAQAEEKNCSRWTKCVGKGNNNVRKLDNTDRNEPKVEIRK